jgi:hypothetical protein
MARIDELLRVRGGGPKWVSAEPLLEELIFGDYLYRWHVRSHTARALYNPNHNEGTIVPRLDLVIIGGESGPGARPCDVANVEAIVQECRAAGIAPFVKQLGAVPFDPREAGRDSDEPHDGGAAKDPDCRLNLVDRKGGDPIEWPETVNVREFPKVAA